MKVHQRAYRSNSSSGKSALVATPQIGGNPALCRAPVVLGGVEIVYLEGRILNLIQYSGNSKSCLLRGCGIDG